MYSIVTATGTGSAMNVAVPPYISKDHITVYVDMIPTQNFEWINAQTISLIAPVNRTVKVVRRTSPDERLTRYLNGEALPGETLEVDSKQAFFLAQEAYDLALTSGGSAVQPPTVGGVELTVEGIKDLLAGQIQPSMLETELRSNIDLITAGPLVPGSPEWLVAQEAAARQAALLGEGEARIAALQNEAQQRAAALTAEAATRADALTAEAAARSAGLFNESIVRQEADISLASQIAVVDAQFQAANTTTNARITAEETARASADTALATSVDVLEATVKTLEDFRPLKTFEFSASVEGWVPSGSGTLLWDSAGLARLTAVTSGTYMIGPTFSGSGKIDGAKNPLVRFRFRTDGTWSSSFRIFYFYTDEGTAGATRLKYFPVRATTEWQLVELDMSDVPTWASSPVNRIRLDIPGVAGQWAEVDWVSVGARVPNTSVEQLDAAIATVNQARADGDSALASSVTQLSAQAGSLTGMDNKILWAFGTSAEGWTGRPTTPATVASGGSLITTPTDNNSYIFITFPEGQRYLGADAPVIRARVRRVSGSSVWQGRMYYGSVASPSASDSKRKDIPEPADPSAWNVLEWDMANLTAGGTDYLVNTIMFLRIDIDASVGAVWEYDWIAVGSRSATPENVRLGAVEVSASALATKVGTVESNYSLKVQARADGKQAFAGIGLSATAGNGVPTQSEMIFMADKFVFVPSQADVNFTPQPLLVMGLVDGQNTLIVPKSRYGDKLIESKMIVDGSIEARNLKLSDSTQLLPDPEFNDTRWTTESSSGRWATAVPADPAMPARRVVRYVSGPYQLPAGQSYIGDAIVNLLRVPVTPGETLYGSYYLQSEATANGNVTFYVRWFDAAGLLISESAIGPVVPLPVAAPTKYANAVTAPATARSFTIRFRRGGTVNGQLVSGWAECGAPRLERRFGAELLVEGSVTADRIDSRNLTIKDSAGNVVFGVGATPPPGWGGGGGGGNLVQNGSLADGVFGWGLLSNNSGRPPTFGHNFSPTYSLSGAGLGYYYLASGTPPAGSRASYGHSTFIPIRASGRYEAQALMNIHRGTGVVTVFFYDAAKTLLSTWDGPAVARTSTVNTYADLVQSAGFVVAPANAHFARVGVTLITTTESQPYMFFKNVFFAEATATASTPSPYDGGTGITGINAANASTFIANAAIGSAFIGQLTAANLTITALSDTVNGGASSGGRVTLGTNKVQVYDAAGTLRVTLGYLL